tara:strand:+ start:269 stop:1189 length:921 start_codon:yes stop_codon:yes gene_type:complete
MYNNKIKRFLSIDDIYSTYERTRNFKKIFGTTRKASVGGFIPSNKSNKIDPIKEVLNIFIQEDKYGFLSVGKSLKKLGYDVKSNIEPDYFYPNLGLIFEFDGPNHYNESFKIMKDERKYSGLKNITKNGENVIIRIIRIPYFVQLSKDVARFIFKDLIIHFSKELKNLPKDGFYTEKKYLKAISKIYKNIFTGNSAQSEYEVLSCGLHSSNMFPSEFTEKGLEKMLKDFQNTPKSVVHQYMWSLKYFIDDIYTYEDKKENIRLVLPTWHKEFMNVYNYNISNKDESLLKCIFTREVNSVLRTQKYT